MFVLIFQGRLSGLGIEIGVFNIVGISTQNYHCSNYYLTVFKNQDQSLVYGTLIEQIPSQNAAAVCAFLSVVDNLYEEL